MFSKILIFFIIRTVFQLYVKPLLCIFILRSNLITQIPYPGEKITNNSQ